VFGYQDKHGELAETGVEENVKAQYDRISTNKSGENDDCGELEKYGDQETSKGHQAQKQALAPILLDRPSRPPGKDPKTDHVASISSEKPNTEMVTASKKESGKEANDQANDQIYSKTIGTVSALRFGIGKDDPGDVGKNIKADQEDGEAEVAETEKEKDETKDEEEEGQNDAVDGEVIVAAGGRIWNHDCSIWTLILIVLSRDEERGCERRG